MRNKYIQIQIEFNDDEVALLTHRNSLRKTRDIDDVLTSINWEEILCASNLPFSNVKIIRVGEQCCDWNHTKPCGPVYTLDDSYEYGYGGVITESSTIVENYEECACGCRADDWRC